MDFSPSSTRALHFWGSRSTASRGISSKTLGRSLKPKLRFLTATSIEPSPPSSGQSAALPQATRATPARSGTSTASLRIYGLCATRSAAGPPCTRRTTSSAKTTREWENLPLSFFLLGRIRRPSCLPRFPAPHCFSPYQLASRRRPRKRMA